MPHVAEMCYYSTSPLLGFSQACNFKKRNNVAQPCDQSISEARSLFVFLDVWMEVGLLHASFNCKWGENFILCYVCLVCRAAATAAFMLAVLSLLKLRCSFFF